MLAAPSFGASSNIALWRAYNKPPVELVVADLGHYLHGEKCRIFLQDCAVWTV